jgi:hypothetical protein
MIRRVARRFLAKDDSGKRYTIIEYQTTEESKEIRSDRMSSDPIKGQTFETADGDPVEKISEDTFQLLKQNKIVRKV